MRSVIYHLCTARGIENRGDQCCLSTCQQNVFGRVNIANSKVNRRFITGMAGYRHWL